MPITATQTFVTSGTWTAPPGYNAPIMLTGFAPGGGTHGLNCSGLFTASAGQSYAVKPTEGSFGGAGNNIGFACNSLTVTWWPGYAAQALFTSGTHWQWQAPAGYSGAFMYHFYPLTGQPSGSIFSWNSVDGLMEANGMLFSPVMIAGTWETQSHSITVGSGSRCLLVWWP